jgi:hypothetical protein
MNVAPSIISASSRPVLGPIVKPTLACPNAPHIPACFGTAEITGTMSGMHGRTPSHGSPCNRSPKGNNLRATGSTRPNYTGVAALSTRTPPPSPA